MERYATRSTFIFTMDIKNPIRSFTTVKFCVETVLKLMLNPSLITVDVFAVVLPQISPSVWRLLRLLPTMTTAKTNRFMK